MTALTKAFVVLVSGLFLLLSVVPLAGAQTFNAADDFSINSNPNGVWSYGHTTTLGGMFTPYTSSSSTYLSNPNFDAWAFTLGPFPNNFPSTFLNRATTNQQVSTANLDPGQLVLHPGPTGKLSVVRWTAPNTGIFSIDTTFTSRDNAAGATTDVHVLHNGSSIFDGLINGGFGPGSGPSFATTLSLLAGDTIDFSVGFGSNGNFFNDSTGLDASISAAVVLFDPFTIGKAEIRFDDNPAKERFKVEGAFTLGTVNDGINLDEDDVEITVGTASVTIHAGLFMPVGSRFEFEGTINGAQVKMKIKNIDADVFEFKVKVKGVDLTDTANPLDIRLSVGDDAGTASIRLEGKLQFEEEDGDAGD